MLKRALAVALGVALPVLLATQASRAQDIDDAEETSEPTTAEAEAEATGPDYGRDGWYLQLGYSHAFDRKLASQIVENKDKFAGLPTLALTDANVGSSPGLNVRAGRRILPNLAVEAELDYQGDFEVEIENFGRIRAEALAVSINFKVPLLTGRFQPYGLLGGGMMWADNDIPYPKIAIPIPQGSANTQEFRDIVDANGIGALFRVATGIDYYVTEHVVLQTEFGYVTSQGQQVDDLKYMTLQASLAYRF